MRDDPTNMKSSLHRDEPTSTDIVGRPDLMEITAVDGIVEENGDFVLFRTGSAELLVEMKKQPDRQKLFASGCALDGRDEKRPRWVTESRVVVLISDNFAVEANPVRSCLDDFRATVPLHAYCLFKRGCYLGEMFYLTGLVDCLRANGRNRFLHTGPPLCQPDTVGSPATPVATV
jgi:hypothetical protein